MSLWEKLKEIIKIDITVDLRKLINININKNSNNHADLKEKGYFLEEDNKTLHINPQHFPELPQALPQILKEHIEGGNKILERKSFNLLEKLYQYTENSPDKAILSFFKQIIPKKDYEALEASLFLRKQFSEGEPINEFKKGIRNRLGDRGNNITNLCTAGYFEEFLMPLYNSSKEFFQQIYEDVIGTSILALFVNSHTKPEDIPIKISQRINASKKYGIKFFHIHGISKNNVKKIKKCIEEKRDYFQYFDKKVYENEDKNIIVVELLLK